MQGPILQFQSTIFQKDDIKKMVQTLNKACGDAGISEQRLDKSFDIWYPTLEKELIELRDESSNKKMKMLHQSGKHSSYAFLMTLSLLKEDFPWIYDMGKEPIDILKSRNTPDEKSIAIREFRDMVNFTFSHPMMRDIFGRTKDSIMFMKELPYSLMRYLDEISEQYN